MKKFIVTFGFGQVDKDGNDLKGFYAIIYAKNMNEARDVAVEKFGNKYSNIYTSEASAGVHRFNLQLLKEVNI